MLTHTHTLMYARNPTRRHLTPRQHEAQDGLDAGSRLLLIAVEAV